MPLLRSMKPIRLSRCIDNEESYRDKIINNDSLLLRPTKHAWLICVERLLHFCWEKDAMIDRSRWINLSYCVWSSLSNLSRLYCDRDGDRSYRGKSIKRQINASPVYRDDFKYREDFRSRNVNRLDLRARCSNTRFKKKKKRRRMLFSNSILFIGAYSNAYKKYYHYFLHQSCE